MKVIKLNLQYLEMKNKKNEIFKNLMQSKRSGYNFTDVIKQVIFEFSGLIY